MSSVPDTASLPFVDYALPRPDSAWNRILLVGEAPGREEVKQGKPFVGRSGQLLNEMLQAAGIERESCLVANVFRFQPPGNKVDHFFLSRRAAEAAGETLDMDLGKFGSYYCRSIFSQEINALKDLIAKKNPAIIMALGRTPLWALTGQNGLLSIVGQRLTCRFSPSIPVIPTYHPSYIMRGNWGKKPEWLDHFKDAHHVAAHSVA